MREANGEVIGVYSVGLNRNKAFHAIVKYDTNMLHNFVGTHRTTLSFVKCFISIQFGTKSNQMMHTLLTVIDL